MVEKNGQIPAGSVAYQLYGTFLCSMGARGMMATERSNFECLVATLQFPNRFSEKNPLPNDSSFEAPASDF